LPRKAKTKNTIAPRMDTVPSAPDADQPQHPVRRQDLQKGRESNRDQHQPQRDVLQFADGPAYIPV
jgi:hypothetical protein